MENQRFEESFREAFDGAEIIPSDSVWTNIEKDLEKNSGKKGLLLLIQLLSAASLLYAMGVTGTYYLHKPQFDNSKSIALNSAAPSTTIEVTSIPEVVDSKQLIETKHTHTGYSKSVAKLSKEESIEPVFIESMELKAPEIKNESHADLGFASQSVVTGQSQSSESISTEPDPGAVMLARLRDEERKYQPEKKNAKEKLWTSIGVGAGSFNASSSSLASSSSNMRSFSSPSQTVPANSSVGTSYSIGISIATRITDRVVVQGGISYLGQNAEFTSSAAMQKRAALNEHADGVEEFTPTSPYKVKSASQYMSIPVQAGYVIIDQDFAVQLNGGISTDIFIQNTLTPENDLGKVTHRSGDDSPYRKINFSGLLGTELSYKVGEHYRVALNPGLRYALNSVYKSEVGTEVSPVTFDVALRFRYIFK